MGYFASESVIRSAVSIISFALFELMVAVLPVAEGGFGRQHGRGVEEGEVGRVRMRVEEGGGVGRVQVRELALALRSVLCLHCIGSLKVIL